MPTKIEKDVITGQDTTGHEWDGIKELDTPLPKWWVYVFYASIVWSLGYYVVYPSVPTLRGHVAGLFGWTQREEIAREMKAAADAQAPRLNRIREASIDQIRQQRDLMSFALAGGSAAFADNCVPCHGSRGAGAKGFPILADDDWLWGGNYADIERTIRFGVRSAHAETRASEMPRFGADGLLKAEEIADVAEHVLALSGASKDATAAGRGAKIFAENCTACHGEKGEGNPEVGAPRLSDRIWLYGGSKPQIAQTVHSPRGGVMPAWEGRLDAATIKMLAIYVHGLGGGK